MKDSPDWQTGSLAGVVLVDDHPLFRRGVAELLNESGRFKVLAQFDSAQALLDEVEQLQPDLALLDLHMPGDDGLALLAQLKARQPELRVVMLTASDDGNALLQAIQSGADGYLLKETEAEMILQRLEGVLEGKVALDDDALVMLTQRLREPMETPAQGDAVLDEITLRERETLALIAAGMSNKLIARELGISDGTVKVHVKSLLRKLDLHSRLELAAWVHAHPELDLERP